MSGFQRIPIITKIKPVFVWESSKNSFHREHLGDTERLGDKGSCWHLKALQHDRGISYWLWSSRVLIGCVVHRECVRGHHPVWGGTLGRVWCCWSLILWKGGKKGLSDESKRTERETRERERKRAPGNLPPHLPGTSASPFLSLTSLAFNRSSQFARRETTHWQEKKPSRLRDTHTHT